MKTISKVLPVIILILFLGLLASLLYQTGKVADLESFTNWQNDTIQTYKDSKGRWVAEKSTLEIGQKMSKELLQKELDQVKRDLDISRKQVESITKLTTKTEGTIQIDKGGPLIFSDPFTKINLIDTGAVYQFDFSFTDSLLITGYYERPKFWKSPQLRVKAISYNPNSKITGLDQITIKDKPTRFTIGIQAGYGFTRSGLSPYLGLGVGWGLFRF